MNQVRSYGVENSKLGTVRGIRITPDDEVDLVELKRDTNGRIPAALREAIGCDYIDCVGLPEFDMWIDDEGILTGAERNTLASILTWPFQIAQGVSRRNLQCYFGTVVLLGVDSDGESHTFPVVAARELLEGGFPGVTASIVAQLQSATDKL